MLCSENRGSLEKHFKLLTIDGDLQAGLLHTLGRSHRSFALLRLAVKLWLVSFARWDFTCQVGSSTSLQVSEWHVQQAGVVETPW